MFFISKFFSQIKSKRLSDENSPVVCKANLDPTFEGLSKDANAACTGCGLKRRKLVTNRNTIEKREPTINRSRLSLGFTNPIKLVFIKQKNLLHQPQV